MYRYCGSICKTSACFKTDKHQAWRKGSEHGALPLDEDHVQITATGKGKISFLQSSDTECTSRTPWQASIQELATTNQTL